MALDIGENGLSFVVFGTVAFSIVMSVLFVVTRGSDSMYDQIGHGGLSSEGESRPGTLTGGDSPAASVEREEEIRQMLGARSERLVRRGEAPLDIDAELARLLEPPGGVRAHDEGLVEEVRQLVLARNERRERKGLEPLDVEAQVAATLAELDP